MRYDAFGPEYVVELNDASIGLRGFLVIDNTVLGLGKGGIRMTAQVSAEEVWRLARTMTWKNALVGIPFGGAKAGIVFSGGPVGKKKELVQGFARRARVFIPKLYIPGPDVNTGEREMGWIVETLQSKKAATGKPRRLGGLPHELGSTGFGVAHAAVAAASLLKLPLSDLTVAIEGFGNVGTFAMKFLTKWGMKVVAVSDRGGTAFNDGGLPFTELLKVKKRTGSVKNFKAAQILSPEAVFGLKVDILIPASVTDVINEKNKNQIRAKIIVEGANIPMKEEVEKELYQKGILIVPDFVANAGGVISSYAEHRGFNAEKMFSLVEEKIKRATKLVLGESLKRHLHPRVVALRLAEATVRKNMRSTRVRR